MSSVSEFEKITNIIHGLRKDVYNTEEFKTAFADKLKSSFNMKSIDYVPDKFGGWVISVDTNNNSSVKTEDYVRLINDSLVNIINNFDLCQPIKNTSYNLANIVATGSNSIAIKI